MESELARQHHREWNKQYYRTHREQCLSTQRKCKERVKNIPSEMRITPTVYVCRICGKEKPPEDMTKNRAIISCHGNVCKRCRADYTRQYRTNHPNQQREWRSNNRQLSWAYGTLRTHMKSGYVIELSVQELAALALVSTNCFYCSRELNWYNGVTKPDSPTLDRIDNQKHVRKDNARIICHECNTTKGTRTESEFIQYCRNISEKFEQIVLTTVGIRTVRER